jgi:cell division protein FtsA
LINREIFKSGYENHISAGVVITGRFSNLEGILELSEQLFKVPVRRGVSVNISGPENVRTEPEYATGVGLGVYVAGKNVTGDI